PVKLIHAGTWFAAELQDKNSWALMSCVVIPGFDFQDFEMGRAEHLISLFPDAEKLIRRLSIN
ncbi:MAG: cupin domain-containing protein, partial [Bacteroidota bacterium]